LCPAHTHKPIGCTQCRAALSPHRHFCCVEFELKFDLAFEDGYKVKNLPYLFYEPENSNQEEIPLIVFLHGMGERGDDLVTSRIHGLPKELEHGLELPSYVVSPQCPRMTTWIDLTRELDCLISTLVANYPIDENRIYITGLSMGGYGT